MRVAPKSPNSVTSTFFNTVHPLPKDLRFQHRGAKLAPCPGRHLTSLRPYAHAPRVSVLLYSSETWYTYRRRVNRLQVSLRDHLTNSTVLHVTGSHDLIIIMR